MTVQTRERLTYLVVTALLLGGTFLYARHWDLQHQFERYRASEKAAKDAHEDLARMEEAVKAERKRAADMDKDPVEKEATIRRISKGVREDEIVYRVEEEAPAARP